MDIGTTQADQLGHAQAGLSREPKHGMVAPPGPSRPNRGGKQCVEFRFGQEGNEPSVEALGGNGKHTFDHRGMLGMTERCVPEQGADRGKPNVTGAHAIFPLLLDVVEEGADECGINIVEVQLRRLFAMPLGCEDQQQPQCVPIGGDCMWTGLTLTSQAVREERLQGRDDRGHAAPPR
jgi:hypothetical protein